MPRGNLYESAVWDQGHTWAFALELAARAKLGARVSFSHAGLLVGLMYLRHPQDHGAHVGGLWETTGGPPIGWSMERPPPQLDTPETAQWHRLYLHPRVRVTPGTEYEFGVYFDTLAYAYESMGLTAAISVGHITLPADNPAGNRNGVFHYGPILEGFDGAFNATLYGVDVLFLPDLT